MVAIRLRGEGVQLNENIKLIARFYDNTGSLADTDSFPAVSIVQPSGAVMFSPTSMGVTREAVGVYSYIFPIVYNASLGIYYDIWQGTVGGNVVIQEYNFIVQSTQLPGINSDGYAKLGDDVPFNYSQVAIKNINKLIKGLRARLNSSGKSKQKDEFGNEIFVDCDIYSVQQLVTFIACSITAFNEIPHFTFFTFEDTEIIDQFYDVILNYSIILAIESKLAIERGRELTINDAGVSFSPPGVSDILNSIMGVQLSHWFEKIKLIKANMKPAALGLGTLTAFGGNSPQIARLRHMREKRLI